MRHITEKPDMVAGGAFYINPSDQLRQSIKDRLTYKNQREEVIKLYKELDNGTVLVPRNVARIHHPSVRSKIEDGLDINVTSSFDYDYDPEQKPFIDRSVELLLQGESHCAQARTGFGKTFTGVEVASRVGKRYCVITTKDDIVDQWIDAVRSTTDIPKSKIGIWRGNRMPSPDHDVVIGLIQSVHKGYDRYPMEAYQHFGLVICDEVHRMGAEKFSEAMWYFPARLRYGLSATAHRKDGRQEVFESHIGRVKVQSDAQEEIPKILVFNTGWKVPLVKRGGQWVKMHHSMGRTMHLYKHMGADARRNAMIVNFANLSLDKGRHIIIFTDTTDHLDHIYAALRQSGVAAEELGYYVGLTSKAYSGKTDKRKAQREANKKKSIVLATYKMASEATNIPSLDTAILGTPRADVEQIVGRIRRVHAGKRPPVVFDLYDGDSQVFRNYYKGRAAWYRRLGCEVLVY